MAKELVKVNENLSVLKCLNEMRAQAEMLHGFIPFMLLMKRTNLKEGFAKRSYYCKFES